MFLVDDLDALENDDDIKTGLSFNAQTLISSTRNPSILDGLSVNCSGFWVREMDIDDTSSLIRTLLKWFSAGGMEIEMNEEEVKAVARAVDGHALGACRAASYISRILAQSPDDSPTRSSSISSMVPIGRLD